MRSAIITGGSQGIGKGIATRLAADGLAITILDLARAQESAQQVVAEITNAGGKARVASGDVSQKADVENCVTEHVAAFGGLDVMVANAGIAVTAHFVDHTPEDFTKSFAVNVIGVFNCYHAASAHMIKQGRGGRLIAAGSVSAHKGGEWQAAYVASKFAVRGLNQTAAYELAKHRITANLYSPSATHTAMYDGIDAAVSLKLGTKPGAEIAKVAAEVPLGRLCTPEDVSAVVSFLASEQSEFVTGQSIVVGGGVYMV